MDGSSLFLLLADSTGFDPIRPDCSLDCRITDRLDLCTVLIFFSGLTCSFFRIPGSRPAFSELELDLELDLELGTWDMNVLSGRSIRSTGWACYHHDHDHDHDDDTRHRTPDTSEPPHVPDRSHDIDPRPRISPLIDISPHVNRIDLASFPDRRPTFLRRLFRTRCLPSGSYNLPVVTPPNHLPYDTSSLVPTPTSTPTSTSRTSTSRTSPPLRLNSYENTSSS